MTVRIISTLAVVFGLSLTNSAFSKDPVDANTPSSASIGKNQALANSVARAIGASGVAVGGKYRSRLNREWLT